MANVAKPPTTNTAAEVRRQNIEAGAQQQHSGTPALICVWASYRKMFIMPGACREF